MKHLKIFIGALVALFFVSCLEISEEVELKPDGSGQITVDTDMSKMIEMLKSFASEEDLKKEGMEKSMDTTIMMRSYLDTASDVSPETKELMRDGVLNMKMNMQENIFKLNMKVPFKNAAQVNKLMEAMNQNNFMNNAFKGLGGGANGQGGGESSGIDKLGSVYDVKLTDSRYSRTLNKARYDSLMADPKLAEVKGMLGMMDEMMYTLTVKTPRPVKSVSNPKAVIADNKRSVTLKGGLMQAIDSPQNLELVIEY
ncbi:hypothetical protein KJS94_16190 [Flavihumibacter rivuli]|uniref:hypothetical protein n=1 Tax=Flavihumibacter rivuli TaxID=2838156 RepID=UPI001BDE3530|nr:hypothetical protein [Flavihumibacter rivuli]ULQ56190.1 hypothetical protein KJS94_16190 [Flavihumibacter rivuli]